MYKLRGVLLAVLTLLISLPAAAQTGADPQNPLPSHSVAMLPAQAPDVFDTATTMRAKELQQWMEDFREWTEWAARWENRRQPGWFTPFRDRPEKPAPPGWLAADCRDVSMAGDPMSGPCALLMEWAEDRATAEQRRARAAAIALLEDRSRFSWLDHIHLDVLWPATQLQSRAYAVVGTHATTTIGGRLQVFVAPGAMFVNLPARDGSRVWRVAANYGIGYRLKEWRMRSGRVATINVNAAKAWLLSDPADVVTGRSMDFAGFSFTFAKRR
jgi:hypothetical protein